MDYRYKAHECTFPNNRVYKMNDMVCLLLCPLLFLSLEQIHAKLNSWTAQQRLLGYKNCGIFIIIISIAVLS